MYKKNIRTVRCSIYYIEIKKNVWFLWNWYRYLFESVLKYYNYYILHNLIKYKKMVIN